MTRQFLPPKRMSRRQWREARVREAERSTSTVVPYADAVIAQWLRPGDDTMPLEKRKRLGLLKGYAFLKNLSRGAGLQPMSLQEYAILDVQARFAICMQLALSRDMVRKMNKGIHALAR